MRIYVDHKERSDHEIDNSYPFPDGPSWPAVDQDPFLQKDAFGRGNAEMVKMFARDLAESDQIRWENWKKRPLLSRIREGFCTFILTLAGKSMKRSASFSRRRLRSFSTRKIILEGLFKELKTQVEVQINRPRLNMPKIRRFCTISKMLSIILGSRDGNISNRRPPFCTLTVL